MTASRAKILMILIEPPLPFGNAASRWFHVLLKGLIKKGYVVDVMVASGVPSDIAKAKEVFKNSPNMHVFPFGGRRDFRSKVQSFLFPKANIFNEDFKAKLKELNPDTYDIIHIEQTWAGWIGLPWTHKSLINVHHLQSIDLQYVKPVSFKERIMFMSWFLAERRILSKYPFVRTCSPRLEPYVKRWGVKKAVRTVPVSLDLSLYPFIPREKRQSATPDAPPTVTLIGNMTWYPSSSAAHRLLKKLWPEIKRQVPAARLQIVGWSARSVLKEYLDQPGVEIFENVPDIQPYFEQASVMIYPPSRGSGMKIKILEALAYGVPVITTSEGAEGLPAKDMIHMGLCDDDAGLIARTVQVLKDPDLQEKLRSNGRELLSTHCGNEQTVSQIEEFYETILLST